MGVMCADAAMSAFPAVSALFLVIQLGADSVQVSSVILCLLVVGAPASVLADKVSRRCGEVWGDNHSGKPPLVAFIFYLAAVTVVAPFAMRRPSDFYVAYAFAVLWGLGMGFYCEY